MHKLRQVLALCILIIFNFSGCSDAIEVDEMTYVLVIGIDRGISDKWRLTVQFPIMKEGSGEEGGGISGSGGQGDGGSGMGTQDGHATITVEAPSFFTGINLINTVAPRRLSFVHTKLVVFSEEIARSGMVGELLAPIIRHRQVRRSMHVLVSKVPVKDFIKANKPLIGKTLSKTIETLMEESKCTGYFPHTTLNEFYDDIKSTYNQPIAILGSINDFSLPEGNGNESGQAFNEKSYRAGEFPREGGNKIDVLGCAVFDGDRMIGELDGDETRFLLIARGDFVRGFFSIPDPEMPNLIIPLDIRQLKKPKVVVNLNGERPLIKLEVNLEGSILAIQSRINYEDPKLKPLVEEAYIQYAGTRLETLMQKCRKELKADIFKFGGAAARKFATIQEWEEYNWIKRFEDAEVKIDVNFKIRRAGTMMRSSPVIKTEVKE
jgi:spore germination protein KC